jgi:hypothetical protein
MVALRKQQTSQWQPALRLVRDEEPARPSLRLADYQSNGDADSQADAAARADVRVRPLALRGSERRLFPRRETTQTVAGHRLDHSVVARRQPVLTLALRDVSIGGLSARTETPLSPGERIAVSFPREGLRMGWDAVGRVIRCEPSILGYSVAVEFESMPSAA